MRAQKALPSESRRPSVLLLAQVVCSLSEGLCTTVRLDNKWGLDNRRPPRRPGVWFFPNLRRSVPVSLAKRGNNLPTYLGPYPSLRVHDLPTYLRPYPSRRVHDLPTYSPGRKHWVHRFRLNRTRLGLQRSGVKNPVSAQEL